MISKNICVIGGGFYGVVIALYLQRIYKLKNISIYEKESNLISRASEVNQARIHGGYHYPRSFITGFRSRKNFLNFCTDWNDCIFTEFTKIYAIAKRNSKVTNMQFQRFCKFMRLFCRLIQHNFGARFFRNVAECY